LAHAGERQEDEYKSFDKYSSQGEAVRDRSCAMIANNLIGEVGI